MHYNRSNSRLLPKDDLAGLAAGNNGAMSETQPSGSSRAGRNLLLIALALLALGLLGNLLSGRGEHVLEVAQETAGAAAAEVRLLLGVNELQLDTAATPGFLLEGQADSRGREQLTESFTLQSGTAVYQLSSRRAGPTFLLNQSALWDLHLNPSLPTELHVKAGVGQLDLELRDALLTRLELQLGVGAATVTLPRELTLEASLPVSVTAGVGNLTLRVPLATPVRLQIETGVGSVEVSGQLEQDGNNHSSPSYRAGFPAIEVNIKGGVGRVSVTTY